MQKIAKRFTRFVMDSIWLVLEFPRPLKVTIAILIDMASCIMCTWAAFYLRTGEKISLLEPSVLKVSGASMLLAFPLFLLAGFYKTIFRYAGWATMMRLVQTLAIYGIFFAILITFIGLFDIPRTVGVLQPILLILVVGFTRSMTRFCLGGIDRKSHRSGQKIRALIYGAGIGGRQLAAALLSSPDFRIKGFVDDDERLHGHSVDGLHIYNPKALEKLIKRLKISEIFLAVPSIDRGRRNQILKDMQRFQVAVKTLPGVHELAKGTVSLSDIRELDIDDLLGREPVAPYDHLMKFTTTGKTVMITGAGGSIGSELARQALFMDPQTLLLVENSEFSLYKIHEEIEELAKNKNIKIVPILANACDKEQMGRIFKEWHPQTVFHAAAYKHVPIVENNPVTGILNNVWGTLNTAQIASRYHVQHFVLISTDKAVRPTNVMGASKRIAELILQAFAANSTKTIFSMVRFGNVLGSSGSVVPRFRQQIKDGGPITLTHPEIIRYFMTISEAAQLVIQASAISRGGEVFVLDMGEPVKIKDLAERMVELSGLTLKNEDNPDGDIGIEIIGLRPGEKLYEELLIGDNPLPTDHPRIMKAQDSYIPWGELKDRLMEFRHVLTENDIGKVLSLLSSLVPEYSPRHGDNKEKKIDLV